MQILLQDHSLPRFACKISAGSPLPVNSHFADLQEDHELLVPHAGYHRVTSTWFACRIYQITVASFFRIAGSPGSQPVSVREVIIKFSEMAAEWFCYCFWRQKLNRG